MFVIIVTRQNWSTREVWPAGPGLDCSSVRCEVRCEVRMRPVLLVVVVTIHVCDWVADRRGVCPGSVAGECGVASSVQHGLQTGTDCAALPAWPLCTLRTVRSSSVCSSPHLTCPASTLQCQSSGPSTGSPPSTCSALTWCCVESPACVGALEPPPPPSPQHMLM